MMPIPLDEDGKFGSKISDDVAESAITLFGSLPAIARKKFEPLQQLTPTPYGTLVFDFYRKKHFVSIEVGNSKFGFYSDLPDKTSPQLSGIDLNPTTISIVVKCLDILYK